MDEDESPQNFRTTSTPPHLARLLKRSPTRDADVVKAQAIDRRETFLQQRKDRLAQCRLKHNQVLVRGRVDIPAKLEALRESLSAAQAARNAIYAKIAANGSKEVAKVNFVVQQNKEKLRLERETKRLALELKQVEAEKRRETALQNRILRRRSASPPSRHSDNSESRDVVAIRRVSDPITAAILLQRFWRSKRTTRRAKNFLRLHLDYGTVGTVPFDVVADVIKGRDVVRCAGKVLESLHIVSSASESSSNAALCRVFLATFMIIGHPRDILMREGPLEDELIHRAKDFAGKFQHWIYAASQGRALCHAEVQTSWTSFSHTFDRWKQVDSANLLEIMIAQYCELDLIYQIVKLDSDPIVATEYHTAIRDNQLQLLVRIRGIAGDETRNLVRSAVIAARRKRLPKRTIVSKPKDIPAANDRHG
ncbi:IQ calmodulin-binding motif domain protein [Taphrina deformans PYCC 5710]|uniref:IQ calmodulin-binding motif domain protein n=1 Tax=Taphrina deformans (strain PYCC 5710 / ATCC 11124 / CBS 356.35 / IMI 108563 / JCM 9778 / NBRC 8474) TaxID=1097556 RepID=R4XDZ5_TAPDE|nr:IQ calmodulin-binding motif domain protein [Taphrina deformans PYCC 5710]|eukprot:CCG82635.1 IQ calmodulin-binding motif domain protein [Taphrina deformans PYCC 5710]